MSVSIEEFGEIGGVQYFITKCRTHFCAYVIVPTKVRDIDCHGGVTYGDCYNDVEYLPFLKHMRCEEGYHILEWDYAHYRDEELTFKDVREDVLDTVEMTASKLDSNRF